MDDNCSKCGGRLSTSQTTVPFKKDGKLVYQQQRRCTECFQVTTVSESTIPPFFKGKHCKCGKSKCNLKNTGED